MAKKNIFKEAIDATEEVKNCYQNGLKALGKYSSKIEVENNAKIDGSIDLDVCVEKQYSRENRWDYILSYDNVVYFVEVHSADTSEVSVVIKKLHWLKEWLRKTPEINKLKHKEQPYFWIQSKGYHISKNSSQDRVLAQNGLRPISKLKLPIKSK